MNSLGKMYNEVFVTHNIPLDTVYKASARPKIEENSLNFTQQRQFVLDRCVYSFGIKCLGVYPANLLYTSGPQ